MRAVTALQTLAPQAITLSIATVRGHRVIVDADLAALHGVETKRFNEAVKLNLAKFRADFMFTLTAEEFGALRAQYATSNDQATASPGRGGRRYAPRVFTEHGALMTATILNSSRAVEVSVYVVRAFVRLRELAATHGEFAKRLDELEQKTEALAMNHDTFSRNTHAQLRQVFDALRELMTPPDPPKRPIGFTAPADKGKKAQAKRMGYAASQAAGGKRQDLIQSRCGAAPKASREPPPGRGLQTGDKELGNLCIR